MQLKLHMVTIEDLVPRNHFLRKLEAALDLSFVYEETWKLYSHRFGRPPIDPVVLVKYLLVGYLYGIPSERQIEQRVQTDVALRWYQSLDTDHGTILDVTVTPGDVHDSVPYLEQMEFIHKNVVPIQAATADSAYDFPLAHQALEELCIRFFARPQAIHPTTQVEFGRELFRYDEQQDCYFCPNGKALELHGVGRSASAVTWQYQARRENCQSCPDRDHCLSESHRKWGRKLERSVFHETVQRDLARQNKPDYLDALHKRQIWCEGTFAAQKWGHNLTRVLRRGLEAAEDHCLLSATALNLKRMIMCIA